MMVKQILCDKGREVVRISPDATVAEAARMLAARRIGSLVVAPGEGEISGIVSERDIVRAIAESGAGALGQPVSAYMTRDVETCCEADAVELLMEIMTRRRLRHLPVVEAGRLTGIVSIGDVVKTRIAETVLEAENLREYISAA